jgi:hypothetical protein
VEESACRKKGEDRRNVKKETKMCESKRRERKLTKNECTDRHKKKNATSFSLRKAQKQHLAQR